MNFIWNSPAGQACRPARTKAKHWLRLAAATVLLLVALPATAGAADIAPASITPDQAIADVNSMRIQAGLAPVPLDPGLNAECQAHNASGSHEHFGWKSYDILAFHQPFLLPSELWGPSVFHRPWFFRPDATAIGFDASNQQSCLLTQLRPREQFKTTAPFVQVMWPAANAQNVPLIGLVRGAEIPDPYLSLPASVKQTGYPITINFAGPWTLYQDLCTKTDTASLTSSGGATVPITVIEKSDHTGVNTSCGGAALAVVPHEPLAANTEYTAHVAGSGIVYQGNTERYRLPFDTTWSFKTGAGQKPLPQQNSGPSTQPNDKNSTDPDLEGTAPTKKNPRIKVTPRVHHRKLTVRVQVRSGHGVVRVSVKRGKARRFLNVYGTPQDFRFRGKLSAGKWTVQMKFQGAEGWNSQSKLFRMRVR